MNINKKISNGMNKKTLSILILVLTFAFTTQALASFTFSSSAITGTGVTSVNTGSILLAGSTSGVVTIAPAATAGTYSLTLPTNAGTSGQFLQTDGSGILTWASAGGVGGSDTQVQFNDDGAFGGDAGLTYNKTTDALTVDGIYIGQGLLDDNTNTAFGLSALSQTAFEGFEYPGNHNTAFGSLALASNGRAKDNTAVGFKALNSVVWGNYNTAVGSFALESNTDVGNTAIGSYAMRQNTTGSKNVAIGGNAMYYSFGAEENVAIGNIAAESVNNAYGNIAIGSYSMSWLYDGQDNIGIGRFVLARTTDAVGRIGIGSYALYSNTTGDGNTAIGHEAGYVSGATPASTNNVTTGSSLTFFGYQSGLGSATQRTNSTALGYQVYVSADNTVVLGDENVVDVFAGSAKQAKVTASAFYLSALQTAPANATVACVAGEIRVAAAHIYVCSATNTWVRAALTTW